MLRVTWFAPFALAGTVVSCGGGEARKVADGCAADRQTAITAAGAELARLTEAEAGLEQRKKDADKAAAAAEKRLAALTIRREDAAFAYPDKMKARVAAGKMRLSTIQPGRDDEAKPLASVGFDMEIQGDYKFIAKMLAGLYEQPKAFFLDRVEVNITDERRKWSLVKVRFKAYRITESATAVPADPGLSETTAGVLAWRPSAACSAKEAPELTAAMDDLRAKESVAKALRKIEIVEGNAKARGAIADGLVSRRDDDRAAWTAHSSQIVENAKKSVTGLAELRFNAKGEPDWKM